MATSIEYDEQNDDNDISRDIAKEIAKNGGVIMLQCLLNIRQSTLIERFPQNQDKDVENKKLDKIILERIRIVMANLERYGYTMKNINDHGMKKEILEDFQSHLK